MDRDNDRIVRATNGCPRCHGQSISKPCFETSLMDELQLALRYVKKAQSLIARRNIMGDEILDSVVAELQEVVEKLNKIT